MMTEAVKALREVGANEEIIAKAERHLAVMTKPRAKNGGVSAKRLENERLAREIFNVLPNSEPVTAKWISEHVNFVGTSQKVVAIAKVATELGLWERVQAGKKIMYQKMA